MYRLLCCFSAVVVAFAVLPCGAQVRALDSIPPIPFFTTGPVIQAHAEPEKPFTVAGERGVVVGQQDGSFESWVLPVKLLSHLSIEAEIEGYTVPIDVNRQAAEVEVRPDRTVITYAHIGFTVRQIMFSPSQGPAGTGPVVLFEFDCVRPTDFTLRFTPEMRWMWPERGEGTPGAEWVDGAVGGYYVLHTDYPELAGAVTMPGARPGILAPYQERPQVHPVELKLHIDPVRDHGRLFPLLMAVGTTAETATNAALGATLAQLDSGIAASYQAHAESYRKLLANSTSIETPDKTLNEAFQWAVVSIEQLRTKVLPPAHREATVAGDTGLPVGETALVAGYYASGDSARPGFGWFFGRDALYTLYAVNGYGDFALSKAELEFLIRRQRADGKIMHEYSQTAANIDWQGFPYMYAAADATPLFLLAVEDYVRSSGDVAFLTAHREAIERAWTFEITHDTDDDGIYDNAQGTGWVESWPGGLPHQEIYLALLDQQASGAVAKIEDLLKSPEKAAAARRRADAVAKTIEQEYYDPEKSCYAFSRNADGSMDRASTVYPALAWWSGKSILAHPEGCLKQFAAHTLNTDWGLRDVSTDEKFYDGMSYHQGSVWPLFTGWAALAEYRANQPLAGYQLLMENANLTRAQDLGAVTELLSGDFFVPFGRSTSHQLWSSAMVITPTLRGLFGIDIDAQTKTITVNPHLPGGWGDAILKNLQVPGGKVALTFSRNADLISVGLKDWKHLGWKLRSDLPGAVLRSGAIFEDNPILDIHTPTVEIETVLPEPPTPGSRPTQFKVLSETHRKKSVLLTFEGLADSHIDLEVLRHERILPRLLLPAGVSADTHSIGASAFLGSLADNSEAQEPSSTKEYLQLHFPPGEGWKTITVTLTW
jgi:glycogen debranching enzyme